MILICDRRQSRFTRNAQIMFDFDQHSARAIPKRPNHAHSLLSKLSSEENGLQAVAVDDLFRSPGNRNARSPSRPSRRCCDQVHVREIGYSDNGAESAAIVPGSQLSRKIVVFGAHMTMELVLCIAMSRLKPRKLSTLRGFYRNRASFLEKRILVKEERVVVCRIHCDQGDEPQSGRICLRPSAACDFAVNCGGRPLNLIRAWRGRRLVPVASCRQRTLAIGQ